MKLLLVAAAFLGSVASATCGGDLDCYLECRETKTDKACQGYGYKPWFKQAAQLCLDENGKLDTDIGGDDFDCGNMDPRAWKKK